MKIVIIGAGSVAFTPAILSGFSVDPHYHDATIGLVDVNPEVLELVERFARRVSSEFELDWKIEASTDRCDVLPGADVVTTSIGVGGLEAWIQDVEIPHKYDVFQPVGDTSGPGGLARALRHIPILVEIGWDMERLCPQAVLYNFANPLTVNTQSVNKLTKTKCIGLCIGVDLTWNHMCRVIGAEKKDTSIVAGGINHCHWIMGFRVRGDDAMPIFAAALDELEGNPAEIEKFRQKHAGLIKRPQEPQSGQPFCRALFRKFGAYPGPGDGHVVEFFPQFARTLLTELDSKQGSAIRNVQKTYPVLTEKMRAIADGSQEIDVEDFARELAWEHTQFLDILVSQRDNLGEQFFVNIPNRGYIHNLPEDTVVEIPVTVDAAGLHPFAIGDLPLPILPQLAHKVASLDLIIEAAMEGSRQKAVQAYVNDPHCTDISSGGKMINELIDAQLKYLPRFAA